MTKSTITRERIQRIIRAIDSEAYDEEEIREWLSSDEIMELARMALAAMDSEPVVQPVMFIDGDISSDDADKLAKIIREFNEEDERPLAKMARIIRENPHPTNECDMPKAQPAPVVPEERDKTVDADDHPLTWSFNEGWNACRAAMLQAEPVTTANKLPDDFDFDRFNDVTWLECVASNPHMHSPTTSTIARVALELNKRIGAGNSPVIGIDPASGSDRTVEVRYVAPTGYVMVPKEPTEEMLRASYREASVYSAKAYRAMLAAAPQEKPVNVVTAGKALTITLPDISSKAFWSGAGKNETFHPETYRRWVKEAVERACVIASIDAEVK